MRAAGTKASPAETGDGPEGSLRHEESDTCGPGDRMQGHATGAIALPAERLSGSTDAALRRRTGKKPPLLRERAGKWLTGPGKNGQPARL